MSSAPRASGGPDRGPGHRDGAPVAAVVVLDTAGHVRMWSRSAQKMLGWTGEHVLGHRFDHLMDAVRVEADLSGRGAARDGTGLVTSADVLTEMLGTEQWNGLLSLRHRDGHAVTVHAQASLLVDGDGRPFVHASLTGAGCPPAAGMASLESLFATSPLGIAIFDNDLKCLRANAALARLDRRPLLSYPGRTVGELMDGPVGRRMAELQRHVLRTGRPVLDITLPGPDGRGSRSVSCSRLEDEDDKVLGVGCAVMDVTERHQSAEQNEIVRERLSLLNDVGARVADPLEIPMISERLADTVVPRLCDYAAVIVLESVAAEGELPRRPPTHRTPLVQLGVASVQHDARVERMLRVGQPVGIAEGSVADDALSTGIPQLIDSPERLALATYPGDPRTRAAVELGVHSLMMLPLSVGGIVLGLLVVYRANDRPPFDEDDLIFAMKLARRAGTSLDNARLYAREREGALVLQRALMPQHIPEPPGVHIAFRYVPGSTVNEAGGDWFDVTRLTGGRVALVIGDVTGHGLRAAATMGLLRTAVRTLSVLELPPAELLRRIDDIAVDLAHDPDETLMGTCVYAVYDPAAGRCAAARAGHVPPLLIEPGSAGAGDRTVRVLDLPSGAPLGVGGVEFETTEFDVADGSVLVLYTDGLIESRGEDIGTGVDRLRSQLAKPHASLEATCDSLLGLLTSRTERDDVAILLARLSSLPDRPTPS